MILFTLIRSIKLRLTTSGDVLDSFGTLASPEKFIVCLVVPLGVAASLSKKLLKIIGLCLMRMKTLFETGYLERWAEAYEMMGLQAYRQELGELKKKSWQT